MEQEKESKIKVFVRVRPPLAREVAAAGGKYTSGLLVDGKSIYCTKDANPIAIDRNLGPNALPPGVMKFAFDGVFDEKTNNQQVFDTVMPEILEAWLKGINCTLFAYGISGSGKTHTMEGASADEGILPRAAHYLFNHIHDVADESNFEVEFSAVQIYLEKTRDLLDQAKEVKIRVSRDNEFYCEGLKSIVVNSEKSLLDAFASAKQTALTGTQNTMSARPRGHLLLTIKVTLLNKHNKITTSSKLNLVHIAGSERLMNGGASIGVMKEVSLINQSITSIGHVVSQLAKKASLIPYRDSQLTKLLRDSIGGNSLTNCVLTVAPSSDYSPESYRTLQFGLSVNKIFNHPKVHTSDNVFDKQTEAK